MAGIAIGDPRRFAAGLLFVLFGGVGAWLVADYPRGQLTEIRAGFAPLWVARGLVLVGIVLLLQALRGRGEGAALRITRPLFLVPAAMAAFAFLLPLAGLIPTAFATVLIVSFASSEFRAREAALIAAGLALFAAVVFGLIVNLSLPLLPP